MSDLIGQPFPENEGVDSISFLSLLLGKKSEATRQDAIHHSYSGLFAIRKGPWKLLCAPGSGGWSKPNPGEALKQGLPSVQLYHMDQDLAERNNLHATHPDKLKELRSLLEKHIAEGRSTPGPKQSNDVAEVVIDKVLAKAKSKKSNRCVLNLVPALPGRCYTHAW